MAEHTVLTEQDQAFHFIDYGKKEAWDQDSFSVPEKNLTRKGKIFLKEALALTGTEISLNKIPVGAAPVPSFWHHHQQNEEIYIFIGGEGEFYVNDEKMNVQEGSVISVKPSARRIWRNTSSTQDLFFIVIQAKENALTQYTREDGVRDDVPLPW